MLKKSIIAAAAAAILAGTFATAAPASAAPAGYQTVHGSGWNHGGPGHWNGPRRPGKPWVKPGRRCEPIVRWQRYGWHRHDVRKVVVGWDCGHRHHYRR